jgi:hypothetical protein
MADTVVQVQDVLNYLGIDYADNMVTANVNQAIAAADAYLKGAVGTNYPVDDPRAKQLALIFIADMYDNREMLEQSARNSSYGNVRRLVDDYILQLKLELRRGSP